MFASIRFFLFTSYRHVKLVLVWVRKFKGKIENQKNEWLRYIKVSTNRSVNLIYRSKDDLLMIEMAFLNLLKILQRISP